MSHVLDHVFHVLSPVGATNQGIEFGANFHLTGSGHFVVVHFYWNAQGFQSQTHGRTQVLSRIHRGNWEVAAFNEWTVACVLTIVAFATRPSGFFRMDFVAGALHGGFPLDAVKNEEFWFWAKVSGVTDAR